ncbi:hypothetical protein [Flavobacterium psychrotrophum]|uniref:hypothetical protein n=1 Tax=Flavobacterium psychrotrophum TaxID=2294119 RepID=UPI000E315A12|nr:hypothetical protein [Flavobacterium psychrotrophum]
MKQLLIIIAVATIYGCASRRKEVHSTETKFKYLAELDTSFSFQSAITSRVKQNSTYQLQQQELSISYDGAAGDSLSVEQYGPDGKLLNKTVFKGKGKGNLHSGNKQETKREDLSVSGTENKSGQASGNKKINAEGKTEDLNKKVVATPLFSFWWWLLLLPVVALWYLNKRYSWAKRFKNHVTNLFS